ncbi:putative peptidyl-tRNA hydrolase PTRHD1 isoform X1 [Protopterus annectens]|uniref:putative peptidyl-tRNA hydrolase PTRHD1 isoform X1 n=1 Tax=Protopterus annectens TaxID=7888 RepID=UPI001CFB2BAE|nr:putative peptidyl-tRNA hydrolase PTRHD1 isoform X1 [Protopterus annectens]
MAGLAGGNSSAQRLIQYVVIRGDLHKALSWPLGAVITQACHAATAAIHLYYSDQSTVDYLRELDSMHKVVLEAADETSLTNLAETLKAAGVDHKLWIEQPENIPTCLALKPYPKELVQKHFKKFKLLK